MKKLKKPRNSRPIFCRERGLNARLSSWIKRPRNKKIQCFVYAAGCRNSVVMRWSHAIRTKRSMISWWGDQTIPFSPQIYGIACGIDSNSFMLYDIGKLRCFIASSFVVNYRDFLRSANAKGENTRPDSCSDLESSTLVGGGKISINLTLVMRKHRPAPRDLLRLNIEVRSLYNPTIALYGKKKSAQCENKEPLR